MKTESVARVVTTENYKNPEYFEVILKPFPPKCI